MLNSYFYKEKGIAGVLFMALVVALAGAMVLSIDGVRSLQNTARFNEAIDIASMAVAADTNDNKAHQKAVVDNYLSLYLSNGEFSNISVNTSVQNCNSSTDSSCGANTQYVQYDISADAAFTRVLKNSNVDTRNFSDKEGKYHVRGTGDVRKYQSDTIDVVFVSDFSGSMGKFWDGKKKSTEVISIIKNIATQLDKNNEPFKGSDALLHRVGIVPFSRYTYEKTSSGTKREQYVEYRGKQDFYRKKKKKDKFKIERNTYFTEFEFLKSSYALDTVGEYKNYYNIELTSDITGNNEFNSKISKFSPGGYTAVYNGLVRGAIMASGVNASSDDKKKQNPRRLIIMLSDGEDNPLDWTFSNPYGFGGEQLFSGAIYNVWGNDYKFYRNSGKWKTYKTEAEQESIDQLGKYLETYGGSSGEGMCNYIRNTINSQKVGTENVSTTIAFIYFGYNLGDHWIKSCVGNDNVYKANSYSEIEKIITGLISEEIGHLHHD